MVPCMRLPTCTYEWFVAVVYVFVELHGYLVVHVMCEWCMDACINGRVLVSIMCVCGCKLDCGWL